MTVALAIRTADRAPGPVYVGATVRALVQQGVPQSDLHVFPTSPDVGWLRKALDGASVVLHVPDRTLAPNENGRRLVTSLDGSDADWLLMLEDDLEFCADFYGSVTRWLKDHQREDVRVYRFCAFGAAAKRGHAWAEYPLREQRGSQAVALRAADARDFAGWAAEHHLTWRPRLAPFQNQRSNGFDKLIGYWALARNPSQSMGLVSVPQLVRHVGMTSGIHRHRQSIRNDAPAASASWSYARPSA